MLSAGTPRLSDLILFDSLVAHMHAVAWANKEGYKWPRKESEDASSDQSSTTGTSLTSTPNDPEMYSSNESIDEQKSKHEEEGKLLLFHT